MTTAEVESTRTTEQNNHTKSFSENSTINDAYESNVSDADTTIVSGQEEIDLKENDRKDRNIMEIENERYSGDEVMK